MQSVDIFRFAQAKFNCKIRQYEHNFHNELTINIFLHKMILFLFFLFQGDFKQAKTYYYEVLKLEPRNSVALQNLARLKQVEGRSQVKT